jgi:hypothetical protein
MDLNPNKFRYILIDEDGDVSGTNSEELAMDFSHGDMNIVVDCQNQDTVYEGLIIPVDATRYEPQPDEDDLSSDDDPSKNDDPNG